MTTDEPDEQVAPASPEDDARIRALLAGARATEPMPAGVTARLDDVISGLAAERRAIDPVPADHVVPITRTRRHRVVAVIGAAAAVAVLALGVGAVLRGESSGEDAGTASDTGADRGNDALAIEGGAREAPTEAGDLGDDDVPSESNLGLDAYREGDRAFAVRSRRLSRDLVPIQRRVLPRGAEADYERALVYAPRDFACVLPQQGTRGVLVGVRYDGGPAFVRFLEPMGESQVVEVLQCGTGDLLRSTTLPTDR